MNGRIKAGWYRHPDDGPDHVTRIVRTGDAWLSTLWSRAGGRPCAAGVLITRIGWKRLEPAEGIAFVDEEDARILASGE